MRRDRQGETWVLRLDDEPGDVASPEPTRRGSEPSAPFSEMQVFPEPLPDAYERAVAEAVDRIRRGMLRKVVLARTIRVEAGRTLDPRELLKRLRAVEPDGYSFAVDIGEGRTLVGASPELLISRFGDEIRANPLAGSAPRAGDPSEDRRNAERLGTSPKDRQEHAIVVEDVFRALNPLCRELTYDRDPQLLATANVWHLSTRFRGVLKDPSVTALDLARALHPTPGAPSAASRATRRCGRSRSSSPSRGTPTRGRSAGWTPPATGCGRSRSDARSSNGSTARLFAGAGIVADSDPAAELDETERKFRAFLDSLRWG